MLLKEAEKIAVATCYKLQPYCKKDRINIAGSIRRKKAEVKDIEIVCLPLQEKTTDLFGGQGETIRSSGFIETVNSLGKIIKGNASGKYMQIEMQVGSSMLKVDGFEPSTINHQLSTINLDLFIPDPADFYRQYAIRTGSAEYAAKVIAAGWKKIGWCGSDKGLRKIEDCIEMKGADGKNKWKCINKDPELPPVWQSEEEFFKWIKVPWEKPMHRVVI